ncbi:hypothetical protein HBB16_03670 [Pseudonocardia sp. MCCB 268]|nr:hypothetical protein [Pseudonocardia cytotoxica]
MSLEADAITATNCWRCAGLDEWRAYGLTQTAGHPLPITAVTRVLAVAVGSSAAPPARRPPAALRPRGRAGPSAVGIDRDVRRDLRPVDRDWCASGLAHGGRGLQHLREQVREHVLVIDMNVGEDDVIGHVLLYRPRNATSVTRGCLTCRAERTPRR